MYIYSGGGTNGAPGAGPPPKNYNMLIVPPPQIFTLKYAISREQ